MKVIFLENIENNKVGDVKEVSDGYARNYLLKNNIAVVATNSEIEKIEKKLKTLQKEEEQKISELTKQAEKLEKTSIEVKVEAGPEDEEGNKKLFGSVTTSDIAEILQEKGFVIDKKEIEIPEMIKELGEHEVTIKLGHGVSAKVNLNVVEKL